MEQQPQVLDLSWLKEGPQVFERLWTHLLPNHYWMLTPCREQALLTPLRRSQFQLDVL